MRAPLPIGALRHAFRRRRCERRCRPNSRIPNVHAPCRSPPHVAPPSFGPPAVGDHGDRPCAPSGSPVPTALRRSRPAISCRGSGTAESRGLRDFRRTRRNGRRTLSAFTALGALMAGLLMARAIARPVLRRGTQLIAAMSATLELFAATDRTSPQEATAALAARRHQRGRAAVPFTRRPRSSRAG
jgi:hypothetical protein